MAQHVGNSSEFVQKQIDRLNALKRSDSTNARTYQEQIDKLKGESVVPKTRGEVIEIAKNNPEALDSLKIKSQSLSNEELKDQLKQEGRILRTEEQSKIGDILEKHTKGDIIAFASSLGVFTEKELSENFKTKPKSIEFLKGNITLDTLTNYGWTYNS